MIVTVRLFAQLRERAGASEIVLELPEGARVRDALRQLGEIAHGLPLVLAVNRSYADEDELLRSGDELAAVPPVSGGGGFRVHVRVTERPLSLDALASTVRSPTAGAVVLFQGVTRAVDLLRYEAYERMAEERMHAIVRDVLERFQLCAAAAEHRVGDVPLSEPSVIVAVSAGHRGEAFLAARTLIDRIKDEVPIWKKEVEGTSERWVKGSLP